jgi:hypothetical protein
MTQSDNIKEFLKYASPRLDYIEHCMEKIALQKAVRRFAGKPGARMFSYKNVAKHAPKGSPGTPGGTVNARYAKQHAAQSAALSEQLMGKKEYAAAVDKLIQAGYNPTQAARIVQNKLAKGLKSNKQLGAVPETMEQVRSASGTVRPVKYKQPVRNTSTSGKASDAASNAANTAGSEPGMWGNITAWAKEHPYLTVGGGVAAGAAAGGGLGYGLGHGAGQQDGAQTAQRYYELRDALDRQRLRQTNDSFLSRLANLFGTGELSNMIG